MQNAQSQAPSITRAYTIRYASAAIAALLFVAALLVVTAIK